VSHTPWKVLVCLCVATVSADAQWVNYPTPGIPRTRDGKPNLTAAAPRTSDGKPDLSGVWVRVAPPAAPTSNPVGPDLRDFMPAGAVIPLQPWAEALYKQRSASFGAGRPSERCLPHGIPDAMLPGALIKIVQTPALTILLYEEFNHFRQVFTDGRPLPAITPETQPAWLGYSVGRWEADTFTIESSGFNDQTWLDDWGLPHTEAMRSVERFHRTAFGRMDMEVTIDDPKAYTRPWSATVRFDLQPDSELIEDICENEQDHARSGVK
jgi:hypothetical protein